MPRPKFFGHDGKPIGDRGFLGPKQDEEVVEVPIQTPVTPQSTGNSVVFFDHSGRRISRPKLSEAERVRLQDQPSVMERFEQPEAIDYFRRYVGRHLPTALNIVASPITDILSGGKTGILTKLMANYTGSMTGSALQAQFPRAFGAPPENPVEQALGNTVMNLATDKAVDVGKAAVFPSYRDQMKKTFFNRYFNPTNTPEDIAAYRATPEANLNVMQATGNRNSLWAKLVDPTKEAQMAVKQAAEDVATARSLAGTQTTEDILKGAQKQGIGVRKTLFTEKDDLYDTAKAEAEKVERKAFKIEHKKAKITGPTTYSPSQNVKVDATIKGPVTLNESTKFAQEVSDSIDEALASGPVEGATSETTGALQRIKAEMDSILKPGEQIYDANTYQPITEKIIPYSKAKAIRDQIDTNMRAADFTLNKTRLIGAFTALKNRLAIDIKESSKSWGSTAQKALEDADAKYIEYSNKIFPKMTQDLLRMGYDPNTTFKMVAEEAIGDPLKARQLVNVSSPDFARDLYFKKFVEKHMGKDIFDSTGALIQFNKDKEIIAEFTNHAQRAEVERFLRVASMRGMGGGANLNSAIQYTEGKAGINATAGVLSAATRGSLPQSALAGGTVFTVVPGARAFFTKILLNPKNARLATEALNKRVESSASNILGNALVGALKGTRVELQLPDGKTYPAEVGKDGKVQIIRNFK